MNVLSWLSAAAAACILLSGCAGPRAAGGSQDVNDPFENVNRLMFNVTLAVDKGVSRPTAIAYRRAVPEPVRTSVRNFLNNLNSPVIFANDLLQGESERAQVTLVRFAVNTTIGVAGLFDIATGWGYPRHSEDFGQTLAVYGAYEGPYIFIPLLGPANPRDILGRGIDFLLDPLTFIQWRDRFYWQTGRWTVDYVDLRARNIETLDEIERTSLDFYASVRSLYRQTRNNEIRNGAAEVEDLPDF